VQHRGTAICTPRNLQMWRADAAATDLGCLEAKRRIKEMHAVPPQSLL